MKKIAAIFFLILALAIPAGQAFADNSYAAFLFEGRDHNGELIMDGTYMMVADLDNDGWGVDGIGMEPNVGYTEQAPLGQYRSTQKRNDRTWLWDPNDKIMAMGPMGPVQGVNGEYPG